jgi:type IV pilus assembly protein PilQ
MILRTLADISGKNVMIDPSMAGRRVTVALDNIPYDQALDIVMTQVNAGMRIRNDVVLFGDRVVLQQRDQAAADELARANDTAPLVSETFTLSYIKPTELVALIKANIAQGAGSAAPAAGAPAPAPAGQAAAPGGGMLSSRGSISPHDLTKKLFVRDVGAVIEAIREVVRNVDVPQKQVLIEARIVEASTTFNHQLGARLRGFTADTLSKGGYVVPGTNTTRLALGTTSGFTNVDTFGAAATPSLARSSTQVFGPSYDLGAAANLGVMLFNKAGTKLLALELQASEFDEKSRIVSSPRIVTMDRKAATINNTEQFTIATGINATTGLPIYQTIAAPLSLTVTPSINPDNKVTLDLNIAKGSVKSLASLNLDTNTISTSVIVENGGTVVIGGFSRETDVNRQDKVPFLGDLPYVGFLFKTNEKSQGKSELLVFITPRIVNDALAAR